MVCKERLGELDDVASIAKEMVDLLQRRPRRQKRQKKGCAKETKERQRLFLSLRSKTASLMSRSLTSLARYAGCGSAARLRQA